MDTSVPSLQGGHMASDLSHTTSALLLIRADHSSLAR